MEYVIILLKQILMMAILSACGFLLFKTKKITPEGSKTIANILIYISLPCVIVNSFLTQRTDEKCLGLAVSAGAAAVLLGVSMLVSRLAFRRDPIAAFACSFSNPGFFGIPLILGVLTESAVFYVAAFIAFLNLLQWSYGVSLLTGAKAKGLAKKILTSPFMIATAVGLVLFFTRLQPPQLIRTALGYLSGLNTPLAMFTVGIYLAQADIKKMLVNKKLYLLAALRLLLIPAASLALLTLLPKDLFEMKLALLICAACPVGSNVAVYAQLHDCDHAYAVQTIVISTVLSVVTIPALVRLAAVIW
ncbi:MAG: AEC family transporter [Clostridia bacterium]|nr:AEC family transporter [Clostridia bacterium]